MSVGLSRDTEGPLSGGGEPQVACSPVSWGRGGRNAGPVHLARLHIIPEEIAQKTRDTDPGRRGVFGIIRFSGILEFLKPAMK